MASSQFRVTDAHFADSPLLHSIPTIRRTSQRTRTLKHKAVKKARVVARVASTLRRRRSALKNRYERAIIQMLERHGKLPKEGEDGLLYRVQQIPSGHSRASLIGGFDAVIEVMSGNDSSHSVTITSNSCDSSNKSKSSSELAHSTVDLLGDDVFGPDEFDRYLGSDCLKPQEASTATHIKIQTSNGHDSAEGLLIQIESPGFKSLPRSPPTLSDSRPTSVDELFFGNTFRLSIRSLMSPPASPSTDRYSVSLPFSPPANLSDSRPPSMDETFFTRSVKVDIQQSLAQIPEETHYEASLLPDEPWPKPLAFRASGKPIQQTTQIDVWHSSPRHQNFKDLGRSLARKRGGQDLRIKADIKLTVTAPTPEPPPTGRIRTVTNTPNMLASGFPTPRSPLPQVSSPASFDSPKTRDHALSLGPSPAYIAYRPDSAEPPWLPLISTDVSVCLLDEMAEELDKVMTTWQSGGPVDHGTPRATTASVSCVESLLDLPILEDLSASAQAPEPTAETLRHAASLDSQKTLFTNVAALLPKVSNIPELTAGAHISDPFTVSSSRGVSTSTIKPQKTSGSLLDDLLTELSTSGMSIPRPSAPTLSQRRRSRIHSDTSGLRSTGSANSSPVEKPLPPLPKKIHPPVVPRRSSSKPAGTINPVITPEPPRLAVAVPSPSNASPHRTKASPSKNIAPITPFLAASPALESLIQCKLNDSTTNYRAFSPAPAVTPVPAPASTTQIHASAVISTPTSTLQAAHSFRDRLTKATLDALLDAKTDADFARAWSTVKKTKRDSHRNHNSEFAWQRWVDRDFDDGSTEHQDNGARARREVGEGGVRRRRERRKRRRADVERDGLIGYKIPEGDPVTDNIDTCSPSSQATDHQDNLVNGTKEATAHNQPLTPRKASRRRSNLFEVLGEEKG